MGYFLGGRGVDCCRWFTFLGDKGIVFGRSYSLFGDRGVDGCLESVFLGSMGIIFGR